MPLFIAVAVAIGSLLVTPAWAQEAPAAAQDGGVAAPAPGENPVASPAVRLELNKLEAQEGGCSLYFVVGNEGGDELAELQTEAYLFDKEGAILRGLLLQFQAVRPGRTKVVAFAVPELGCDAVGRVLINDVPVCNKADASPIPGCAEGLQVSSRSGVELAY